MDERCNSLPDCSNKICTRKLYEKILQEMEPRGGDWFKTWPERLDKLKNSDTMDSTKNTQKTQCDNANVNKFTFNEALKTISLAYSPVTKQLHLMSVGEDTVDAEVQKSPKKIGTESLILDKFDSLSQSSTSTTSPSDTKSFMVQKENCTNSNGNIVRRKSFSNFFSRNILPWSSTNETSSMWKIFGKAKDDNSSPIHLVASSSALIQNERPSTLPAKSEEEEERHKKEYKNIIADAKKKEVKSIVAKQKVLKLQLQQEEQQAAATKYFLHKVLPDWEAMRKTRKTIEMWWHGLPSSVRGKVWRLAIGNELNLSPQLFEICLSRVEFLQNSGDLTDCAYRKDHEGSMNVIPLDISRTFTNLGIFQEGGPYSNALYSLLAAYVCYRPDVGYVQGMSYIAAILILNMEQVDAFICFANLLNQPLHLSAFTLNQCQMHAYYNAYNQVFSYNLPKLYTHFQRSGLTPDLYLLDWIYTIYAKAMPLDVACRIWDIFLRDGYEFIFRTAIGILHLYQDDLLNMDFLHGSQFLTRLPEDLSSDVLFKSIQSVTTSTRKKCFSQILDKCSLSDSCS